MSPRAARTASRLPSSIGPCRAWPSSCPIDRRYRRWLVMRRCRCPTARAAWPARPTRRAGCKHRCRHCPIVPVYDGQFRVVPADVVLADIDQQVGAGAEHITFGDPDFFNGPTHARRIVEALHARHPALTYDVTIKVEHLLKHRELLPVLARTGCLFVTSAVEAVDDGDSGAAREGAHASRLRRRGRSLPGRRPLAGPDVRGVHAVDDGRGLPRPARDGRVARSGGARGARPVGASPACDPGFAPPRTRRPGLPAGSIRSEDADVSVAAPRSAC